MSYTLNLTFNFGAGNTGLTLNGKLFDSAGAQVGSTVTSGFVELGTGGVYSYLATLPDGQVGTFVAYKSTDATIAVASAVNPQEGEYTDAKTSGRMATYTQPTGFLAATFPGTVASPTNITAAAGCAVSSIGASVITAASIADGAITDAKFTVPSAAAGRPTGMLSMLRRIFEWRANKRTRDRTTGNKVLYDTDGTTALETQVQSTTSTVDQETQGA